MATTGGFSFKGISISSYGMYYAPERQNWHIWEPEFKPLETSTDQRHGEEWYGSVVNSKGFGLRCYYEEVTEAQLAAFLRLFSRDSSGELIFEERPWQAYTAAVTKKPDVTKYPAGDGVYNGTVVVHLKCHYPFAISKIDSLEDATSQYPELIDRILATTGLLDGSKAPVNTSPTSGAPATNGFTYLQLNGGNQNADTIIRIAGDVGNGLTISNPKTGQVCKIVRLTKAVTTDAGKWLELNSRTGEVYLTNGTVKERAYQYHDLGFVQVAPGQNTRRSVAVTKSGSTIKTETDVFFEDKGNSVYIDGGWREIVSVVSPREIIINSTLTGTSGVADIAEMNRIYVIKDGQVSITKFEIVFNHTFE